MKKLLQDIRQCRLCAAHFSHPPRPIVQADKDARIAIVGQAPGQRVQKSGIPWNDPSGERLRSWLAISEDEFYGPKVALVPMGFCYPGKGKSGDLPPRKECAPTWHPPLWENMPKIEIIILVGSYATKHYYPRKASLTAIVEDWRERVSPYFPLPHPSPRNIKWFKDNPWFEDQVLSELRRVIHTSLE